MRKMKNRTDDIREYIKRMGRSSPEQAARDLGIDINTVRACCGAMHRRGELVHPNGVSGCYVYREGAEDERAPAADLRTKIWRAVRISRTFTVWEIAQYSGATLDYTKKYIASLVHQGLAEKAGRKGPKAIYRCLAEGRAATPKFPRRRTRKDRARRDLIDLGWALMRALRDGDLARAHGAVIRLHADLGEMVRETLAAAAADKKGDGA